MLRRIMTVLCCLLLLAAGAAAETARDISKLCSYDSNEKYLLGTMTDRRYTSAWTSKGGRLARLDVNAPEDCEIGGVYIQFYNEGTAFCLETQNAAGEWETAAVCPTDFLTGYAQMDKVAKHVRIRPYGENWATLCISEIHVYTPGEPPAEVQRWEAPLDKADMLVLSTHPDDELLFLGGTIPYYAGEKGLDVQVAYLVPSTPYRKLELLDGLWHCGLKHYPDIGGFRDVYSTAANRIYSVWDKNRLTRHIAGLYRRYRPEVVVAQDLNGEYGHGAHKAAAETALACIPLAADAEWQDRQLAEKIPWQVKKLYLHLYPEGALTMDWRRPLEAFGGKTALDVAAEAFLKHTSQQTGDYAVLDSGETSCSRFGLAFTAVGADEKRDDFMEHVE